MVVMKKPGFGIRVVSVVALLVLASSVWAPPAWAQAMRLQLDHLTRLAEKASETVDVTVDQSMLQLAAGFLSAKQPDQAAIKELVGGLKGIYVRSYSFERDGGYSVRDVDEIRKQLQAPGWSRLVNIQDRKQNESVEVYLWRDGDRTGGLTVLATEARELTVVNIVGSIDLARLAQLGGMFGIPALPPLEAPK